MSWDVAAISVVFQSHELLRQNAALCDRLNPGLQLPWISVDNSDGPMLVEGMERFSLRQGTPDIDPAVSLDRGSLHHAEGLMVGKAGVATRYLLVIDPDFYVLRPNWVAEVLEHMESRELSLFGSCWHPRWYYQYRGFPTVHFMLIDLHRLPLELLDFTPGIREDWFYRAVDRANWLPYSLSRLLRLGRLRDTGYRIRESVLREGGHRFETLVPHYTAQYSDSALGRLLHRYPWLVPDRLSLTPRKKGAFTEQSFLREMAPRGYAQGWEEFFWQGEPFAVHLRNIGRGEATGAGNEELRRLLQG